MSQGSVCETKSGSAEELCLGFDEARVSGRPRRPEETIREVFAAFREPVYRYLLAVPVRPSDAEDLTQEAFIRLYQELRAGRAIGHCRAWLFRVAHNLAVDFCRKSQVTQARLESLGPVAEERADPAPGVLQRVLEREQWEATMARLSPQERRCMELRTEGLRYREIAQVLGIRIPTVQTVLVRAVQKLLREEHG